MNKRLIISLLFMIFLTVPIFSLDFDAYRPIDYPEFIQIFKATDSQTPGISIFRRNILRVHAILHEYPKIVDDSDINNLRFAFMNLGIHPDDVSYFGYKVEYTFPSNVEWQEETKLIFYIQNVQREHFEKDFKINDPIYWFVVFNTFNSFSQQGYILVSNFMNEEQFAMNN